MAATRASHFRACNGPKYVPGAKSSDGDSARARMREHKAEGRISIHVLSGHVQLKASGRTFNLRSGGLLALDQGVSHDVHALEKSALLLTIAWPKRT